jgi:purine-cytosine permease-like protein
VSDIRRPNANEVEQHGIDTIPAEHRLSGQLDLFRVQFGGAKTFATVIPGTIPIMLGLSLWQARGVIYAVLGAIVIVVVVYGYAFMLLVNKIVVVGNTALIALDAFAYAGKVDFGFHPGPEEFDLA